MQIDSRSWFFMIPFFLFPHFLVRFVIRLGNRVFDSQPGGLALTPALFPVEVYGYGQKPVAENPVPWFIVVWYISSRNQSLFGGILLLKLFLLLINKM